MTIVTTASYDQLGQLIRNNRVSLNNGVLIFGQQSESISKYLTDQMGDDGYVIGIRGNINPNSARLLEQLDPSLHGNKIIIEAPVEENDIVAFSVKGIEEAAEILEYGLPEEILFDQLDQAIVDSRSVNGVQIICAPVIQKKGIIRITSLHTRVDIEAEGITFVKLR